MWSLWTLLEGRGSRPSATRTPNERRAGDATALRKETSTFLAFSFFYNDKVNWLNLIPGYKRYCQVKSPRCFSLSCFFRSFLAPNSGCVGSCRWGFFLVPQADQGWSGGSRGRAVRQRHLADSPGTRRRRRDGRRGQEAIAGRRIQWVISTLLFSPARYDISSPGKANRVQYILGGTATPR